MSFEELTTSEIAIGEPTKRELFRKAKDNFTDLNSRVLVTEAAIGIFVPLRFGVTGPYWQFTTPNTEIAFTRLSFDITVLGARIFMHNIDPSASGTTTCDVQFKRGAASFTSIYSTLPSVASGDGDYALSTNEIITTTALKSGDILRFDITSAMTQLDDSGFELLIDFEKA